MSNPLSAASGKVSIFAKWFAGIGLLVMTAIISAQVFARYVLNDSPAWAEQAALLLMIWYVFTESNERAMTSGRCSLIACKICRVFICGWQVSNI